MKVFSKHRRKIEPYRRYGSRDFRDRVAKAKDYKRTFDPNRKHLWKKLLAYFGLNKKLLRYAWVLGAAVILYFIVISPYFLVSEYSISGNRDVKTGQITEALDSLNHSRLFLIPKNSLFLLSEGRVNSYLSKIIPDIKEVRNINRGWPNKIKFEVIERSPGFILSSNGRNYLVDEAGVVVKESDNEKNLPVLTDQVAENFSPGQILSNSKLAPFVITMARQWPEKISSPLSSIKVPGVAATTAQFTSQEGWSAVFDTNRPVTGQLASLVLILNKQIPVKDRHNLAYIDLSLEKWAYYCYINTPCSAEPQQNPEEGEIKEGTPNENGKK